jgi:glucose/arabinose dehydrogenase
MDARFLVPRPPRWLCLALLFAALPALAADPDLQFTQISDREAIVDIANAGDGSGRLFFVEQSGRIFINEQGADIAMPFLDIRDKVTSGGERGLLSLAFAPNYSSSGYFFVWYTEMGGDTVLCRFRVSADPNVADPATETLILRIEQPFSNHNGGRLRFGPDGMLYLGTGDGGSSFDPGDVAQDGANLLGKLLRLDVDPAHGAYAVPPDNPFVDDETVRGEIWALGLRNPWRIAFDRGTGNLFIADVGQNEFEEINFQPAGSGGGENYGWDIMEASQCTGGNACDTSGFTLPVAEYDHQQGCSVTGGEVYRGNAYPNLEGMYFFGDYCSGNLWALSRSGSQWDMALLADTSFAISTFGLGEDGSVYLANYSGGVYLLSDGNPLPEVFQINAGLNDAWYNPETAGQGFLVTAFPEAKILFLAWFTYDVERPPQDVTAMLGEPGHRWLTAQGPYGGDMATLAINVSSGGVFDSAVPAVDPPVQDGTMTITWSGCNSAVLSYQISSLGLAGEIPLQRIVTDNVALCQALQ